MTSTPTPLTTLQTYYAAWQERDDEVRFRLLECVVAPQFFYQNQSTTIESLGEFNCFIEQFHNETPEGILVLDSAPVLCDPEHPELYKAQWKQGNEGAIQTGIRGTDRIRLTPTLKILSVHSHVEVSSLKSMETSSRQSTL